MKKKAKDLSFDEGLAAFPITGAFVQKKKGAK